MAKATYPLAHGKTITVEYDPDAPCEMCGFPVQYASMGGTTVCPWCDTGSERPEVTAARIKSWEATND